MRDERLTRGEEQYGGGEEGMKKGAHLRMRPFCAFRCPGQDSNLHSRTATTTSK